MGRGMKGPDGPGAYANWNRQYTSSLSPLSALVRFGNSSEIDCSCYTTVVHYTSDNLKSWRYNQTVRTNSFAYDSDVFRLADGRYILFSTGQTRSVRGNPKVLQSRDLYNWEVCVDPELQVDIDEGCDYEGGLGQL